MRLHVALASAYASCAHTVCLQQNHGRIIVVGTARTSPGVRLLVKSVVRGLRAHQQPEASTEGLGGTYFFLNEAGSKASHPLPVMPAAVSQAAKLQSGHGCAPEQALPRCRAKALHCRSPAASVLCSTAMHSQDGALPEDAVSWQLQRRWPTGCICPAGGHHEAL